MAHVEDKVQNVLTSINYDCIVFEYPVASVILKQQ